MPLKCLSDDEALFSFAHSQLQWDELKSKNRLDPHLKMPCCGAGVVLKTSKLGTRFFAHQRAGDCIFASETAEHLLAKSVIARAVLAAGWRANSEVSGTSDNGEEWVADVMAIRGNARVAIEVQWSEQSHEETKRRQQRYARSGVRGLWLLRHPQGLLKEKATPAFRLCYSESTRSFSIMLPSQSFSASWVNNRTKNEPWLWQQEVELADFVAGALAGALKYAPAVGCTMPVAVNTAPTRCWRCKKLTNIVTEVEFLAGSVLVGHPSISTDIYTLGQAEGVDELLATLFSANLLEQHGIGRIKRRFSKTVGGEYLSNGCIHCDALQGRFFDHESAYGAATAYQANGLLSESLATQLEGSSEQIYCWWFDKKEA